MADHGLDDTDQPRRLRRGAPPRLYLIARKSPVPWLRVRRLGDADRVALILHFGRLAAAERLLRGRLGLDETEIAALCARLDFSRMVALGAIAGNAIIAAACGVPVLGGLEVGATEDTDYLGRDLGTMLVSQVLGAQPGAIAMTPLPVETERALLGLIRALGGRVEHHHDLTEST